MFRRSLIRLGAFAGAALLLAACGTLPRDSFDPAAQRMAAPAGLSDVRFSTADAYAAVTRSATVSERLRSEETFDVLALSGGGANGAYGAGVLVGWTQTGERPEFDIVTGVSTGALAAPFAFLGWTWDNRLQAAYTDGRTENLLRFRALTVFRGPAFFSVAPVRQLVDAYVTPEMLRAVAEEHAKGRRLLVATTNLDTQETIVWDMGAIATWGDQRALKLFRDVLIASASIPGVFLPVMIEMEGPHGSFREMHVDGAVTTPFFSVPESMLLWTDPAGGGVHRGRLYVIINGQVGSTFGITRGSLVGILSRSFDAASKSSTRTHLAATAAFCERNGLAMKISAIPDDVEARGLDFSTANMRQLFGMGHDRAVAHDAWQRP